MAKVMRKEFFAWDSDKIGHLLNIYLNHANWQDIRITSSKVTSKIARKQKVGGHDASFQFSLEAKLVAQGDGTNVLVTVEEPYTEWSKFVCDVLADDMLAALHVLYDFEGE